MCTHLYLYKYMFVYIHMYTHTHSLQINNMAYNSRLSIFLSYDSIFLFNLRIYPGDYSWTCIGIVLNSSISCTIFHYMVITSRVHTGPIGVHLSFSYSFALTNNSVVNSITCNYFHVLSFCRIHVNACVRPYQIYHLVLSQLMYLKHQAAIE